MLTSCVTYLLSCPEIIQIVNDHDLFVILESWLGPDDSCPNINGYTNFRSERKKKWKARRNAGGIIIYIRKSIAKGVTKIENSSEESIWMKLNKSFFWTIQRSIFMCSVRCTKELTYLHNHRGRT